MFQQAYQGGLYVEVLSAKDAKNCKDNTERKKFISSLISFSQTSDYHFDQELKSFVLKMSTKSSQVSMPSQSSQSLALVQPFVVFQIKLPESNTWSIILILNDTNNTKRRVNFSNCISTIEQKYFSLQVPVKFVKTGQWLNLSIDMPSFMSMFPGQTFRSLEGIIICSQCIIRRILTTKSSNIVNNHFAYPTGIDYSDVDINLQVVKDNCPEFNEQKQLQTNNKQQPTKQPKQPPQKAPQKQPKSQQKDKLAEESNGQEALIPKIDGNRIQANDANENEFLDDLHTLENKVIVKASRQEKKKPQQKIKPQNPWSQQEDLNDESSYIPIQQQQSEDEMPQQQFAQQQPRQDNIVLKIQDQNTTKRQIKKSPKGKLSSQKDFSAQKVNKTQKQQECVENLDSIIAEINGLQAPTNQSQQKQQQEVFDQQFSNFTKNVIPIQPQNMVELVFDPVFQCYIDIKTGEYFVAKT